MHRRENLFTYILMALIAVGLCAGTPIARAQALYGSIYGQVTDPSGAAVPKAGVTVTDVSKGTSIQVTTNDSGEYQAPHLIPDTYVVKAVAPGFRPAEIPGVEVAADTAPKVDLKLEVGNAQDQNIIVTEEAPQLKTDRADVAAVFNEKTVSDLPIEGRNFANLELLIPGAQVMGWSQNAAEDSQGSPTVQIAGQSFSGVDYELDGAADQDPILGQIVINPPLDAVTEAKISTQSYDAEFGQAVAAVVSAQTKSGTNIFHGDAFDYRRSDAQLARNPFNQAPGPIPAALYSQFGGSIGGPILKNKTFFFGDYQAVRQRLGSSAQVTVPTKLIHDSCLGLNGNTDGGCNFSEYLDPAARGPQQGQIYNPRVIDPVSGPQPFAGNIIPKAYLSSQALYLLNLIPYPNSPGTADGTANNFNGGGNGVVNQNQFDVRVDHQLSETMHLLGRYSYFDNANSAGTIFGAAGGTGFSSPTNSFGGSAVGKNQSAVTGMDIALSPKLLTDFRLGYLRYHVKTAKFDGVTDLASMAGIPGLNTSDPSTAGSPAFYPSDGLSNFGSGLGVNACNCSLLETENQYQVVNNWTRIFGNHSLKFGADLRYGRNLRVPSDSNRAGELSFSSSDTENTTDTSLSSPGGSGLATFLLGDVTNLNRYVSSSLNAKESQKRVFSYAQDNWRVTPRLTLNLGVRWEIYFPETVNGKGQGGFADLTKGQIRVAGVGGLNTAMNVQKDFNTIAPRIGLAFQLNPKTVIRAGYGRSFDIGVFGSIFGHVVTQNLPVLANQDLVNTGVNTAAFNLAQGPTPFQFPTIPSSGLITIPNGDSVKVRQDPNRFPTIDAWNVSFERELNKNMSFTLAYVGNKGTHTFSGDGQTTNPNEAAACLPASLTYNGQTLCYKKDTTNIPYLEPYFAKFGWTQGITYYNDAFDTHYNSLQATIDKHFSQGLQFTGRYTWQRAFNDGGDYQDIDKKVDYGRFDDLREQEIQVYGKYDLPFGKHGRFLNSGPAWLDYLVGGYELNNSLNLSSGLPFTPSYGECGSDIPDGPCMPNKTSASLPLKLTGFVASGGTGTRTYFQPGHAFGANGSASGVFLRPQVDQFGNVGRNSYFGPWFFNDDISIIKSIPIWERVKMQFRVDAFNAFNHISPGNPGNVCIDCSGAGVITGMALGSNPRQLEFSATVTF